MAYSGKYNVKNKSKYKGDFRKVVWRSSWEYRFMKWADNSSKVLWWNSEEIVIPYLKPTTGRIHRYFPDFLICVKGKDNKQK